MAFVTDTFTDTAATALGSHTGETGASWTIVTDNGGNGAVLVSDANRIRANALGVDSASVIYTPSGTPASADYSVEADFRCVTNTGIAGILIRAAVSGPSVDGYFLQYRVFFGWRLWVFTGTTLGAQIGSTYATEMSDASTVHAKLTVSGSSFTVELDSVSRITGSDSTYSAAGKPGVIWTTTTITNSTGVHLDNFVATDAAGGAFAASTSSLPTLGVQ